jgi:hypothetical protein
MFGDGIAGRRPKDNAIVIVEYRVTNGELPNGAFKFTSDGPIESFANVIVSTVTSAIGGAVNESLESIRFNAPRHYTTQERAITPNDYETLLKVTYPEINAISAYGGEEETPPQYGRVFLSVDIKDVEGLPTVKINEYYRFLKERSPISIEPVFKNPDFTYIGVTSSINYDITKTDLEPSDIETLVISAISSFNTANLNNFKKTLRYSRLLDAIDVAHPSIISNETSVRAIKVINPVVNKAQNLTIKYDFPLINDKQQRISSIHSSAVKRTIESSIFTLQGRNVIIEDDGNGLLVLAGLSDNNTYTIIKDIGTVDYGLGQLVINDFLVSTYPASGIKFYARPSSNDIYSTKNNILTIKIEDISITAIRSKNSPDSLTSTENVTTVTF